MTRLEELTFRAADRGLDAVEQSELETLLSDPAQRERHVRLLELEVMLRGEGRLPGLADATVAAIGHQRTADLERSVMQAIAALPAPVEEKPSAPRRRNWALPVSGVTLAAIVFFSWLYLVPPNPNQPRPVVTKEAVFAVLIEQTADVVVLSPTGERFETSPGQVVRIDETVRTEAEDGYALLQYADGTRFELFGGTSLRVEQRAGEGRRVQLLEGSVRADVKPQPEGRPLVVRTPHADLRVLSTRFGVAAQEEQGTRIHLESGKVELVRPEQALTELLPGNAAFISASDKLVIEESPSVLIEPDRELSFAGLRSFAFKPGPTTTIVGVTQRQAVTWQPLLDHVEATPLGGQIRKSYDVPVLNEGMAILNHASQLRMEIWDLLRREARYAGPNPEAKGTFAAVSPVGDWWAYWVPPKNGVRIWRPGDNKPIEVAHSGKIACAAVSPDGRWLALGRHEKEFVVDLIETSNGQKAGQLAARLKVNKHPLSLAFSADGKRLIVGHVGRLQVWDIVTQTRVTEIDQPGASILHVAISPDGRSIAAAAQDDWVWVWKVAEARCPLGIRVGQPAKHLAFAPDNRSLGVLDKSNRVTLWNLPRQDD